MRIFMVAIAWTASERPECAPYIHQQVESLRRAGLSVELFCFRGNKAPMNYLRAWREVRDRLRLRPCDVIHAHFGQSGVVVLPSPHPLVVTFHGSDLVGYLDRRGRYTWGGVLLRRVSQRVALAADEVIVVSKRLVPYLPKRPFHLIPHGVDRSRFRPMSQHEARTTLGLPLDTRLVLFASSPGKPVKRFGLAQASVSRLDARYAAELLVVDDAPHQSMPLYMNACDVLLITSFHEGSPTIVKEAIACGLPVVSVDVGDVRERIGEIEGCVVCADAETSTVSGALTSVLETARRLPPDPALHDVDEEVLTRKVIAVYERARGGAGPRVIR